MTPQETDPDLPVMSGSFRGGVGQQWPAAGLGVVSVTVHAQDLLKELTIIFITSPIVCPQVKQ